ncbi:hypothetical protein LY90DRAFT_704706 [Neocallimastix californiae]|jgi:rhamnogalacturonan endolyase|uniref:rhamnogalacturonan endolyase n=1 Tax=Neocallimastix californiae TaxID=1754190 RepID=A0A1Y2BQY3_9FUNG|nr:hypothetical protein LY90DRAFT_704706 [Neocallimastix californiae]|eukprot:ORY37144.1 hypothetical protein LY90DRAFT_704706 [Neocallimastix californiae]
MNLFILSILISIYITTVFSAVKLTSSNTDYTFKNDYATIVISKSSGFITSIKLNGNNQEFLNRSYIDANGGKVYFKPDSNTVIKNTSTHAEVSFIDKYSSGDGFALDWEVRYTMLSDTKGIYYSLTHKHPSSYPATSYGESRLVLRLKSEIFNWLQVEDDVYRDMPSAADQDKCQTLSPVEACRLPDGNVIHKYDWSVDMLKHQVHGFASSKTGLGCWFVSPSYEWKIGGAYNRDLSCHQGGKDSLQIMYTSGTHYGSGETAPKAGENWNKVYGPFLIYLNKASSPQAAWNDAKTVASVESSKWPYSFVSQPEYVQKRGEISGTLAINNPLTNSPIPLEDAVVVLVQPESAEEPIPQKQWRHMSFWTHSLTGKTPNFSIKNVIPGTYQLRAWSKGVVGEFIYNKLVTVRAGENANLGTITFKENRVGPVAWEIGIPDRTAKEFLHGNHFNQWGLYHKFTTDFPKGVNYYIGKSNYSKDWNYAQVSVPGPNGNYQQSPWNIYFNMNNIPSSSVVLRISIAASSYSALSVSLNNGKATAEIKDLVDDAAIRRDGIRGIYRELEFKFSPSEFKIGENMFTLYSRKIGGYSNNYSFDGILYDHIRLEVPGTTANSSAASVNNVVIPSNTRITTTQTIIKTTTVFINKNNVSPTPAAVSTSSYDFNTNNNYNNANNNNSNNESCVQRYGQCGGANYQGSTTCCSGTCKFVNDWYSQCS